MELAFIICGTCLDLGLNKPNVKRQLWDNWGNMNMNWVLKYTEKSSLIFWGVLWYSGYVVIREIYASIHW